MYLQLDVNTVALIKLFRPVIYTVLRKHWAFHILYKRVVFMK